jgi:transcriptional regulator with XRE-family HTH domain
VQNIKDDTFLLLLGKRIRQLRKSKNLSQLDLAVKMENHSEQIGRIERGTHNVTICTLRQIADSLEISLSELLNL